MWPCLSGRQQGTISSPLKWSGLASGLVECKFHGWTVLFIIKLQKSYLGWLTKHYTPPVLPLCASSVPGAHRALYICTGQYCPTFLRGHRPGSTVKGSKSLMPPLFALSWDTMYLAVQPHMHPVSPGKGKTDGSCTEIATQNAKWMRRVISWAGMRK